MEHASAQEFAQIGDVERTGLGTPATRAGVLEKLVRGGFLERKGRQLLPTKKGTFFRVERNACSTSVNPGETITRPFAVNRPPPQVISASVSS